MCSHQLCLVHFNRTLVCLRRWTGPPKNLGLGSGWSELWRGSDVCANAKQNRGHSQSRKQTEERGIVGKYNHNKCTSLEMAHKLLPMTKEESYIC